MFSAWRCIHDDIVHAKIKGALIEKGLELWFYEHMYAECECDH